jgi:pyridoxine 5-phosphate synthase
VYDLAQVIKDHKLHRHVEFNIEGNPFHNLMPFVEDIRPDQVTFVPDSVDQPTSDHGWRFPQDFERLRPLVARANELGVRVSLFMDALPEQMHYVKELGAQRVELYTEPYAGAFCTPQRLEVLHRFVLAAQSATEQGLALNAGHDLNLDNLGLLIESIAQIQEVSIGHAFIADSLEMGYEQAVKAYVSCMQNAHGAKR